MRPYYPNPGGLQGVLRIKWMIGENTLPGRTPRVGLDWTLRICISHKFLGDADTTGLGSILCVLMLSHCM